MERIDHNGENFYYLVSWRQMDVSNEPPNVVEIDNWQKEEYVTDVKVTFKAFEIFVQACNSLGCSKMNTVQRIIGYSGEGSEYESTPN